MLAILEHLHAIDEDVDHSGGVLARFLIRGVVLDVRGIGHDLTFEPARAASKELVFIAFGLDWLGNEIFPCRDGRALCTGGFQSVEKLSTKKNHDSPERRVVEAVAQGQMVKHNACLTFKPRQLPIVSISRGQN